MDHWQDVYEHREPDQVSWHEPRPEASLALIAGTGLPLDAGGGISALAGELLRRGYTDVTVASTDTEDSPWFVVEADDKRSARLNLISHLLDRIPHQRVDHEPVEFPPRQERDYQRPPADTQKHVPERLRMK